MIWYDAHPVSQLTQAEKRGPLTFGLLDFDPTFPA